MKIVKILSIIAMFLTSVLNLSAAEIQLSGSVISDNQKMITSRYMGFVKEIGVSEGDIVKKGELLYEIDSREIDSKKEQAELGVQMYENQYMNVKINLERHKRLFEKDMVSKYELENLELAEKNLKAQVEISKAQLEEVMNQYKYLRIVAPNDGVVVAKNVKVGEMAIPGMPAIVLSDLSSLKIESEISETNLKEVSIGTRVTVRIPSSGYEGSGKVAAIIPSSNPMTHKFRIKISFDNSRAKAYPGMYAEVIIK